MTPRFDVIIIGAGAAGMMAAGIAGQRGRRVLLIDHYHKLGEKIRISGGGRCNFTNLHTRPENFISQNPRFCRSALARYTPQDFIKLVEQHRIKYHEKTLGQLFCDDSATAIIQMLKIECDRGQVQWKMPCAVNGIEYSANAFTVHTGQGKVTAHNLIVATGGLSVPKIGATPFGYKIAEQFGLKIVPPRPALVPLSFDEDALQFYGDLSGIALDAEVSCNGGKFREALLLTHRGLSSPAILQISSYWQNGPGKNGCGKNPIHINLLPDANQTTWLHEQRNVKMQFNNVLAELLPRRFAQNWCTAHGLNKPTNQLGDKAFAAALAELQNWQIKPSGTLGYNKARSHSGRGGYANVVIPNHGCNLDVRIILYW